MLFQHRIQDIREVLTRREVYPQLHSSWRAHVSSQHYIQIQLELKIDWARQEKESTSLKTLVKTIFYDHQKEKRFSLLDDSPAWAHQMVLFLLLPLLHHIHSVPSSSFHSLFLFKLNEFFLSFICCFLGRAGGESIAGQRDSIMMVMMKEKTKRIHFFFLAVSFYSFLTINQKTSQEPEKNR